MSRVESLVLVHNTDRDRFELWDGETFMGLVGYEKDGEVYILLHTVIEEHFGQQGIARLLVSLVLTRMRLDGNKIRPVCSYVRRFLIRFPEYQLLVAPR
ncbi:MAG: GNAT family N-acetyltransferase [Dietzia sp.]|jgi:predicted GNAT family acetyltransferase|uniref:GNAT family N-acetyltransferase n=1 Tax=Dietzia TaxID=37914 RepID=UPI0015C714B8|nr:MULTISPECIES: GNAT family N-acetyltransferase [Dietzia]MBB1033832.1 N-acetyltransferase [Dietzia sp. CQ4]MBB1039341.1 N-acetyltransferase [Dietzia natronolimnaea]MBB1050514.1 N-acetyltransferase [Dietzia sp. CW19]MBB1054380.1 N-acetyltransferase [Dietzia sp. B44]MBB1056467.1 N-acetyltransferase [Dietzia sp. B19]